MIDKYQMLAAYLKERADRPFEWGVNDCCIFAADWVRLVTGRDPAQALRGEYSDEAGAAEVIDEFGGVANLVSMGVGSEPLPNVATAQRGDVVLFESGNGPALGICAGEKFAAVRPVGGVGYFSMRHAVTAWRVA